MLMTFDYFSPSLFCRVHFVHTTKQTPRQKIAAQLFGFTRLVQRAVLQKRGSNSSEKQWEFASFVPRIKCSGSPAFAKPLKR